MFPNANLNNLTATVNMTSAANLSRAPNMNRPFNNLCSGVYQPGDSAVEDPANIRIPDTDSEEEEDLSEDQERAPVRRQTGKRKRTSQSSQPPTGAKRPTNPWATDWATDMSRTALDIIVNDYLASPGWFEDYNKQKYLKFKMPKLQEVRDGLARAGCKDRSVENIRSQVCNISHRRPSCVLLIIRTASNLDRLFGFKVSKDEGRMEAIHWIRIHG